MEHAGETFADLGIPFRLFEAPVASTGAYRGRDLCEQCGSAQPHCFRPGGPGAESVCHTCLQAGQVVIAHETELGCLDGDRFVTFDENGVEVAKSHSITEADLRELSRTPDYHTWQGSRWLFCCSRPMIFLGDWSRQEFAARSPSGDGLEYMLATLEGASADFWEYVPARAGESSDPGIYMFRCQVCSRHRGHYDFS